MITAGCIREWGRHNNMIKLTIGYWAQNIIYGLVFIMVGILMIRRIDLFWNVMRRQRGGKNENPDRRFILGCKISGVAVILFGTFLIAMVIG